MHDSVGTPVLQHVETELESSLWQVPLANKCRLQLQDAQDAPVEEAPGVIEEPPPTAVVEAVAVEQILNAQVSGQRRQRVQSSCSCSGFATTFCSLSQLAAGLGGVDAEPIGQCFDCAK